MAVTLKDIARELGVSVVTVSKVLRNRPGISEETRRRVLERMKELNYRPNLAARALITGRTNAIGLVVPDLLHPFFAQVAKALSGVLRAKGYCLILSSAEDDGELERTEIDNLLSRRVDALLIASAQTSMESFQRIEESGTPYVLIDRRIAGLTAHFVGVDDTLAGELATRHLIDQGCRRIAHIRGAQTSTAVGRFEGYRRALAAHGLEAPPELVVSVGTSPDDRGGIGGAEAAERLLQLDPRPDGIFCYNDPVATGALRVLLERGLRVPEDVSVVGCGNHLNSDLLRVPLTTVDQNSRAIGEAAAELAVRLIEAGEAPPAPQSVLLDPKVVVRASSLRSSNCAAATQGE